MVDKNLDGSEMCFDQKTRAGRVKQELRKTVNKLAQDKIASLFQVQVYVFNCTDRRHEQQTAHFDFVVSSDRLDAPGAVQAVIRSLETVLAQLKTQVA